MTLEELQAMFDENTQKFLTSFEQSDMRCCVDALNIFTSICHQNNGNSFCIDMSQAAIEMVLRVLPPDNKDNIKYTFENVVLDLYVTLFSCALNKQHFRTISVSLKTPDAVLTKILEQNLTDDDDRKLKTLRIFTILAIYHKNTNRILNGLKFGEKSILLLNSFDETSKYHDRLHADLLESYNIQSIMLKSASRSQNAIEFCNLFLKLATNSKQKSELNNIHQIIAVMIRKADLQIGLMQSDEALETFKEIESLYTNLLAKKTDMSADQFIIYNRYLRQFAIFLSKLGNFSEAQQKLDIANRHTKKAIDIAVTQKAKTIELKLRRQEYFNYSTLLQTVLNKGDYFSFLEMMGKAWQYLDEAKFEHNSENQFIAVLTATRITAKAFNNIGSDISRANRNKQNTHSFRMFKRYEDIIFEMAGFDSTDETLSHKDRTSRLLDKLLAVAEVYILQGAQLLEELRDGSYSASVLIEASDAYTAWGALRKNCNNGDLQALSHFEKAESYYLQCKALYGAIEPSSLVHIAELYLLWGLHITRKDTSTARRKFKQCESLLLTATKDADKSVGNTNLRFAKLYLYWFELEHIVNDSAKTVQLIENAEAYLDKTTSDPNEFFFLLTLLLDGYASVLTPSTREYHWFVDKITRVLSLTEMKPSPSESLRAEFYEQYFFDKCLSVVEKIETNWISWGVKHDRQDVIIESLSLMQGRELAQHLSKALVHYNFEHTMELFPSEKQRLSEYQTVAKQIIEIENQLNHSHSNLDDKTKSDLENKLEGLYPKRAEALHKAATVRGFEDLIIPVKPITYGDLKKIIYNHEAMLILVIVGDYSGALFVTKDRLKWIEVDSFEILLQETRELTTLSLNRSKLRQLHTEYTEEKTSILENIEPILQLEDELNFPSELEQKWDEVLYQFKHFFWDSIAPEISNDITTISVVTNGSLHNMPLQMEKPPAIEIRKYQSLHFFVKERTQEKAFRQENTCELSTVHFEGKKNKIPLVKIESQIIRSMFHEKFGIEKLVSDNTYPAKSSGAKNLFIACHGLRTANQSANDLGLYSIALEVGMDKRIRDNDIVSGPSNLEIVYLSTCLAGTTYEANFASPVGIAASFLRYADVVIASLFPIPDRWAPLLSLLTFDYYLYQNKDICAALEMAKRDLFFFNKDIDKDRIFDIFIKHFTSSIREKLKRDGAESATRLSSNVTSTLNLIIEFPNNELAILKRSIKNTLLKMRLNDADESDLVNTLKNACEQRFKTLKIANADLYSLLYGMEVYGSIIHS